MILELRKLITYCQVKLYSKPYRPVLHCCIGLGGICQHNFEKNRAVSILSII